MTTTVTSNMGDFLKEVRVAVTGIRAAAEVHEGSRAERIASRARELAPKSTDPAVAAEEQLKGDVPIDESITVRPLTGGGFAVEVGSKHAPEVEFGTSKMRAEPFLRPAVQEEIR